MNVLKNAHFPVSGEETINFVDSTYRAVRWPWVEIETDSEVAVKLSEDTPDENAWIVKSHAVIPCGASTIYISGNANMQIVGLTSPGEAVFKAVGKGGESWVNATGNPITLRNLQGGVPFNCVTVSGDDIIGQEMTLTVSGRNIIPYPYTDKTKTTNGINYTLRDDGTISATAATSGTAASGNAYFSMVKHGDEKLLFPAGTYSVSGCPKNTSVEDKWNIRIWSVDYQQGEEWFDYGDGVTFTLAKPTYLTIACRINKGAVLTDEIVFKPMVVRGNTPSAYEMPVSVAYPITPDSNPYTVPQDVAQLDGTNVISVDADAMISVNANKKNPQLAKIYDKINETITALIVGMGGIE